MNRCSFSFILHLFFVEIKDSILVVPGCGKTFLSEVELEAHQGVHDNRDILTANGYRFPPPIPQNREDGTPGFACPVEGCNLWSVYRQRLVDHLNDHAGCKPYGCTHPGKDHLLLSAI